MSRLKRALRGVPAVALALLPLSAVAASPSPSPASVLSPTLDKVLLVPPAGYVAVSSTSPPKTGHVSAHEWAQQFDVKSAEAERLLNQDGFVDGYNLEWASGSTLHVLNEFVLAFRGGKGAGAWFTYFKGALTSAPVYQHADTISGIPSYFGLHETQSSVYGQAYLDGFVFVKGNDLIGVAYISLADDNLNLAIAQAKNQYAAAPASTIPPAQWPENANPGPASASPAAATSGGGLGKVLPYALIIGAALVAIGLGAALLLARVRRPSAPAAFAPAPAPLAAGPAPPAVAAVPAAVAAAATTAATLPLQMSADGNYWYDGERWVDVNQEAPPFAQRSPDGAFWWDGYNWRPVPLAQPPVSGR